MAINRIGFIGAGNVSCHMALALLKAGCTVPVLVNRQASKTNELPEILRPLVSQDISELLAAGPDLVIAAVSDGAIAGAVRPLYGSGISVVHTSGAIPSSVLEAVSRRHGSFYPLQTMTMSEPVEWREVPLCIYADDGDFQSELLELGARISGRPVLIPDEQRRWLHLAAVLLNNNINHILALVRDLMDAQQLNSDLLKPLLEETIRKAGRFDARKIQTGPARRNDQATHDIHRELLETMDGQERAVEIKALYDYFWNAIQQYYGIQLPGES